MMKMKLLWTPSTTPITTTPSTTNSKNSRTSTLTVGHNHFWSSLASHVVLSSLSCSTVLCVVQYCPHCPVVLSSLSCLVVLSSLSCRTVLPAPSDCPPCPVFKPRGTVLLCPVLPVLLYNKTRRTSHRCPISQSVSDIIILGPSREFLSRRLVVTTGGRVTVIYDTHYVMTRTGDLGYLTELS